MGAPLASQPGFTTPVKTRLWAWLEIFPCGCGHTLELGGCYLLTDRGIAAAVKVRASPTFASATSHHAPLTPHPSPLTHCCRVNLGPMSQTSQDYDFGSSCFQVGSKGCSHVLLKRTLPCVLACFPLPHAHAAAGRMLPPHRPRHRRRCQGPCFLLC